MANDNAPSSTLQRVAERLGITSHYVSAWGDTRAVPDASLRALAAALGVPAARAEETEAALRQLEREAEERLLPPVAVVEQGTLPPLDFARLQPLDWKLTREDGAHPTGDGAGLRTALSALPPGYHSLQVQQGDTLVARMTLIVAPLQCFQPERWASGERHWALTAQLYSLRSASNWGIGDFSDLVKLMEGAAAHGAAAVGLNPLHALFPADPSLKSPYSPSSRSYLNPLYLDLLAIEEWESCPEARALLEEPAFAADLHAARTSDLVDYERVSRCKTRALGLLHRCFRARHLGANAPTERGRSFLAFQQAGGAALRDFARFEVLHAHFLRTLGVRSWHAWPEPFHDAHCAEVEAFVAAHAEEVERAQYAQWECDRQLAGAVQRARAAGMAVGLYQDVAVGVSPDGADAWAHPDLLVPGVTIGAPPDLYNPKGQSWGLAPLSPRALRAQGYAPFVQAIRASMRHAGAMRLDHVLGLMRLWWIPEGQGPEGGAYVQYPLHDLLGIVALESQRHRCLVVGEDLGTVPDGFREEMHRRGILSYRLLMFERDPDGGFIVPADYPALAAVAVSTHDLATWKGFWSGRDLDVRRALRLFTSVENAHSATKEREAARTQLQAALRSQALHAPSVPLLEAVHAFLARTPSRLLLVQVEDLLGQEEQMNLPGTVDEHPNWRRKLSASVERLWESAEVRAVMSAVARNREATGLLPA